MRTLFTICLMLSVSLVFSDSETGKKVEETYIYSPIGKRDPFKLPLNRSLSRDVAAISSLERYGLEQLQLRAILKGLGKNKAMFEDPDSKTHIVTEGSVVGREKATVSRILNKEVILTVKTFNYLGAESLTEKVISLPSEEEGNSGDQGPIGPVSVPGRGK